MEPLKNCFNHDFVSALTTSISCKLTSFEPKSFQSAVLTSEFEQFELKQRMRHISVQLARFLPGNYQESLSLLLPVSKEFDGLAHLVFSDFVEIYGFNNFRASMEALEEFTTKSSSEFAIRPFLVRYPEKTLKQMKKWSKSRNEHLRRLSSEGGRPRLPWAMALPEFKKDPKPILDIIVPLIADDSLYVRRSVANNFNDISKDNPQLIRRIASKYLGKNKSSDWTIKHGCRTLLKSGDPEILNLFGFKSTEHLEVAEFKWKQKVAFGGIQEFSLKLKSTGKQLLGKLRLEFIIGFVKANGSLNEKVFKISEGDYKEKQKFIQKRFSFKPITTRKYYPGIHRISLVCNGVVMKSESFELQEPC